MTPVIILLTTALIIFFYLKSIDKKKYQEPIYLDKLKKAQEFLDYIHSQSDYITWKKRDQIKSKYLAVGIYFNNKSKFYKKEKTVQLFNNIFQKFNDQVVSHNNNFVELEKERLSSYFDNIEEKKLDNQQRNAVITDEYSNLIVAGAGSGKTLTILGKVKYLIEQRGVQSNEILLLSFTKKTVYDLNNRLKELGLKSKAITFHKLGYDVIKKYHTSSPALTNENTLRNVIKSYLDEDVKNDDNALESYIQYIACYMNIPKEYDDFDSLGEKLDTEKGIDFQTLKSKCELLNIVRQTELDTFQGERVKSIEELTIANFLYLNGIEYQYERAYPFGDNIYRPDFYLSEYDIYLEHFGVDENDRARWLSPFNEHKYIQEMYLKRETHKRHQTTLIETYSYYNRDNILLEKLTALLVELKVNFRKRDSRTVYSKVLENDEKFGKEINKLIQSFINLSKSRDLSYKSINQLFASKSNIQSAYMLERQKYFLQFAVPILKKYDKILGENNEIDFNDMINLATKVLKKNKPNYRYKYIIVDEYQDVSMSRFNLIKQIRELSGAKLVCVGDDWQSIYRFAGSDISLFSNFGDYVGEFQQLLIEKTYRHSQSLIDVSSGFIQKNSNQIPKNPKSKKENIRNPIKLVYYKKGEIENTFLNEIQLLVTKYGKKSILVLGRHNFDIDDLIRLSPTNKVKYFKKTGKLEIEGFKDIDIKFLSVHQSKGLESDNVIILNLSNNLIGFPNKITDDPILSVLLSTSEQYRFAEERRLFYVALTRTRNEVILLIPPEISLFAKELIQENKYLLNKYNGSLNTTNCPYCRTGKLVIRENIANATQFLGCSNYPNCNQTFNDLDILDNKFVCSRCVSGFMIRRSGKYGSFLGCTNYPDCRNTVKL